MEARKRGIGKSTLHYLREKASGTPTRSFRVYSKVRKRLMPQSTFSLDRQCRKDRRKGGPSRLRRRAKLIIGVVATLALLICGATYLLLIEWPSTTGGQPMVQQGCCGTELLRSGEPTRTISLGEYSYEVRFHNATGGEAALVGASIQYGGPPQPCADSGKCSFLFQVSVLVFRLDSGPISERDCDFPNRPLPPSS